MTELKHKQVVTCFLRNRGEVLLLRRSAKVGSYQGRWGAVSGYVEDTPEQTALKEISEETGLGAAVSLVRQGESFTVEDEDLSTRWIIHPFLFDCAHRNLLLDWESTEAAWVPATEILARDTVPQLWTSYDHVAPSLNTIRADHVHGSAYLSYRALEVLRDRAGWLMHQHDDRSSHWTPLRQLAADLVQARPSMAVIANRVNRVMHTCGEARSAQVLEQTARAGLAQAYAADEQTAQRAARYADGRRVLTLSRSGTLLDALLDAEPTVIVVAESRPGGEGVAVAEQLAQHGHSVTLIPDSAVGQVLQQRAVDIVLVGADAILFSGAFVNKVGTQLAALAAHQNDIPFFVVTATDKLSVVEKIELESMEPSKFYSGLESIEVICPLFETTPPELVTGFLTESGEHSPAQMRTLANEFKRLATW
jgi:translation initiation factor 2B subunit (eIF-2B alpha/beta/delta family)